MKFDEFLSLLHRHADQPWVRDQTPLSLSQSLMGEVEELQLELATQENFDKIADELADVMSLVFHIQRRIQLLDPAYDLGVVLAKYEAKLRSRKPHMFDASIPSPQTPEEDHDSWVRNKQKESNR